MEPILKTNFVIITSFISLFAFSSLIGCDYGANTTTICKNNPEICADLHRDSWCRFEKGDLIRKRYLLKQTESPTGKQIYKHLLNLEKYNQCIELASGVQHILHPERTNDRMRAFGLSSQSLAELQATTKPSKDLYLSFYHWTRFSDQQAQQRVLNAEAAGEITETFILAQLASYYQKSDLEKRSCFIFLYWIMRQKKSLIPIGYWVCRVSIINKATSNSPIYCQRQTP